MAFLMLLHEKMRLQRKVNKLTLRELKMSSRKERITKNISRVQKMYSSKMTQLEKQASILQKQFTVGIQNQMGLGTQNQMFNPYGGGGITSFVANQLGNFLSNGGQPIKDAKGNVIADFNKDGRIQQMMQDYYSGGFKPVYDKEGDTSVSNITGYQGLSGNNYTKDEYACFQRALNAAQQQQSQAQMMCQQMSSNYEANISVWLEAQKAQLEAEQDMALAPLEAEETDMDLEKESCEAQLADAKARLESIKQACSEGIKDSAPTFGLG